MRISAAERREVIFRAAGRLFAERGYEGTRLDDVAAAAGVTKPIVYRHFDSKKALYMALLEKHEADLPSFLEGTRRDPTFHAILEVWLDYVRENQHAWLMLFRDSAGDEEIQALRAPRHPARPRGDGRRSWPSGGRGIPPEQVEPTAELLQDRAGRSRALVDRPPRRAEAGVVEAAARFTAAIFG